MIHVDARCPNPRCALAFPVPADRLGRNVPCPACGQVITVRADDQVLQKARERDRIAAVRRGASRRTVPMVALLDGVRSLWNVGSMFRTSDAVGLQELVLCGITGKPPRKEISKTALGAEEVVPWRHRPDAATAIDELRAEQPDLQVVALEWTSASVPLDDLALTGPCCLLVGNEVAGVGAEALARVDHTAHLNMRGIKTSFNVAVAFGIAVYLMADRLDRPR
jgi:tRNA G18 (ribose-2'-O)-methylase SpoU